MKFDDMLTKSVKKALRANVIPMLLGEPGIGKSSWVEAMAKEMHTECFTLPANQLADKADLTGARMVPYKKQVKDSNGVITEKDDYKQQFYPHATIVDAINYAENNPRETPILFIDELNRTTPDVTSELLSIPTQRKIGKSKLPANLKIVTAGNDKGNVTSLDSASVTRFALLRVEPDAQTFLGLDPDLNIFIRAVLTAHPECILCKPIIAVNNSKDDDDDKDVDLNEILDDGDEMVQFTTPRTIDALSRWLNEYDNQELMELIAVTNRNENGEDISMLQELIEGVVGTTVFATYLMAEISSKIMTVTNSNRANTVAKPAVYDQMKACPDMNALNSFISSMSDRDRSGSIVYALQEKTDNTVYLNALSAQTATLEPDDMKTLAGLFAADQLDNDNVIAFKNTKTPLANMLSLILA